MMKHQIQWMAPSPFWKQYAAATDAAARAAINQPAILRFATDSFMDEFVAMLENDPARVASLGAAPETWRGPAAVTEPVEQLPSFARSLNRSRLARMRALNGTALAAVGPNGGASAATAQAPLKLYQPSHQRYYLVAASLVCRMTGFPDRKVDPGRNEKASFVVRRLRSSTGRTGPCTAATCDEYGFVLTPSGHQWQKITTGGAELLPREERLPLSAMSFIEDDGRKRRVYTGLIPVSNRESYIAAGESKPAGSALAAPLDPDSRVVLFQKQVTGPWKALTDQAAEVAARLAATPAPANDNEKAAAAAARQAVEKAARERAQSGSWYVLLDFAKFLQQYVPRVWAAISGSASASDLTSAEQALLTALSTMVYIDPKGVQPPMSLAAALSRILGFETGLETVTGIYREDSPDPLWPSFRFALADADASHIQGAPSNGALNTLVGRALPADQPTGLPPVSLAAQTPLDVTGPAWFTIRCVYERPDCGPLDPPVISDPTTTFQMAAFFDPDAPARPIRIGLPIDTSPAGLRKFDKNTAFMISDVLCGQMQALGNLSLGDLVLSVLPWPFHKDLNVDPSGGKPCGDGDSFGFMCSFSIPIITICAIILLMIMVKLFDIFFSWMIFFRICFPLPKFKAKS